MWRAGDTSKPSSPPICGKCIWGKAQTNTRIQSNSSAAPISPRACGACLWALCTGSTGRHPMIDMEQFERRLRQSSGNQTEDDPLAELTRLTSGQRDLVQRVAEPQGQSSTEARQGAASAAAPETEAQEPHALQRLDDDKRACQDSGTVNEKIGSRRSLYIMIMAPIITVGMIGIGASVGY